MEDLSFQNCVLFSSCLLVGMVTGYKLKRPLKVVTNLVTNGPTKLVLVVREDLKMGKGKLVSQCCHGTLASYVETKKKRRNILTSWELGGQAKVVVKVKNLPEMLQIKKNATDQNVITCLIRDAGRTQIAAGSETVLAVGPDVVNKIDQLTGHLKLL